MPKRAERSLRRRLDEGIADGSLVGVETHKGTPRSVEGVPLPKGLHENEDQAPVLSLIVVVGPLRVTEAMPFSRAASLSYSSLVPIT